jgi:FixJ family two-component response regulator
MSMKILVVDDSSAIRQHYRRLFEKSGFRVGVAEDGVEALEQFRACYDSEPFDLVLTDHVMPNMNGEELAQTLAAEAQDTHVVMISAVEDVSLMMRLMRMGIVFFRKSSQATELLKYIENAAEKIQTRRQESEVESDREAIEPFLVSRGFEIALPNDIRLGQTAIRYVLNKLQQYGVSDRIKFRANFGLTETIINAIAHGNLKMSSAEFKKDGDFEGWHQEIRRRAALPEYRDLQVTISVAVRSGKSVSLTVRDQGTGFDHEKALSQITSDDIYKSYGRGLVMLQGMADELRFNDSGNEVTMRFAEEES